MRIAALLMCPLLAALLTAPALSADSGEKTEPPQKIDLLADGLGGWESFLQGDVKMEDVWSLEDGVLKCKGEPLGYLYTKQKFDHFRLSLEWRWPGEPGNSGVLLRIAGKPISFLPKCVECQLRGGSAGDIWGFYGFQLSGPADRLREVKDHEALGDFVGVGHIKSAEKPAGEWNRYDITLQGGRLAVRVNGEMVNQAKDCEVLAGPIGLQSEGGEIHFRNIHLTPLPAE